MDRTVALKILRPRITMSDNGTKLSLKIWSAPVTGFALAEGAV